MVAVALLACVTDGGEAPPAPAAPFAPAPVAPARPPIPPPPAPTEEVGRVIVVAVDGAAWPVIDWMNERGELPTLARLRAHGCDGDMASLEHSRSAVIWTTVATGVPEEVHGILDFAYEQDGRRRLYLNDRLGAPPLWERLSDAGTTVGVTNWWVSTPVVPVEGYLVSDHVLPASSRLTARTFASEADMPARDAAALVYPAGLWDALAPALRPRLPTDVDPGLFAAIDDTFAQDAEVVDMTLRASKGFEPRLQMVYLKGIDIASHYLWGFFRPEPGKPDMPRPHPRDLATYGSLVPAKYRHTDVLLGELLATRAPEDVVVVLSDHGFGHRKRLRDVDPDQFVRGFHRGTHGPHSLPPSTDGIFVVAGGPVSRAACPDRFSLLDVAPTVLWLLGQPVPAYMPGAPVTGLFDPAFVAAHAVARSPEATPERKARGAPGPEQTAAEQAQLEALRALGYFEESP